MGRKGAELDGYNAALELLLNEVAYLAWCEARNEDPLPVDVRRGIADFLGVVGGDGNFYGSVDAKRAEVGNGRGWAAPSTFADSDKRVWHPIEEVHGELVPVCGAGHVQWEHALRISEVSSEIRWCWHTACQKAIVQ